MNVRASTDKTGRPVRPRDAASLVILRGRGENLQVLMGKRASAHRFMPDVYVFPGGGLDREDRSVEAVSELHPTVAEKLERKWSRTTARALAVAAIRETYEEAGLIFGRLEDGKLKPSLHVLDYVARAITPPDNPIRFHARFFSASADHAVGTVADSRELQDLRWIPMQEALSMPLVDVTEFVLREISRGLAGQPSPGTPLFSFHGGSARIRYE